MKDALIYTYRFHKQEFGVRDNRYLRCFDAIVEETPCNTLECSPSVSPGGLCASRFRAGYMQYWIQEGLDVMLEFVHAMDRFKPVKLNPSMLELLLGDGFDLSKVDALGMGIDLRPRLLESKIKCYFLLLDCVGTLHRLISFHPPVNGMDRYFIHNDMVVGIDMYFNGNTGIELYPYFTKEDLKDENLMDSLRLGEAARALLYRCGTANISFDRKGKRIFHFFPMNPTPFIQDIGNRDVNLLYSSVRILNMLLARGKSSQRALASIALYEDEIQAGRIQNVNLYYTVSGERTGYAQSTLPSTETLTNSVV